MYLPADKNQYSKALLLADCATGKISIYPERNLQASTARKSILNYLYTTPAPEFLITNKASSSKDWMYFYPNTILPSSVSVLTKKVPLDRQKVILGSPKLP
jgi:hypothetical protein